MGDFKKILTILFFFAGPAAFAQETKTKNVVVITLDGYRWQEVFQGASKKILDKEKYVTDKAVVDQFYDLSPEVSREKLMPFFWNTLAQEGQLYGNRAFKNKVNCSNHHLLSYPGYSEMLVGFPERKVTSNDKKVNPNATVLEFIQQQKEFRNKVAAFSTWDAFPFILREEQSEIYVNAGTEPATGRISEQEEHLNKAQIENKNPHGSRYDEYTYGFALEYMKRERPRVIFIGFDETDEHGHGGRYDEYLKSAHKADRLIGELWAYIQSDPFYRDQTTLLITTDHGRGKGRNSWRKHQLLSPGSGQIWFAVLGPDTPAFGEMKFRSKYYQKQVASTVAAFLGLPYKQKEPVGEVIQTMLAVPGLDLDRTLSKNNVTGSLNEQ
jgi:hypothetical protein